eukprot:s1010_g3.t1
MKRLKARNRRDPARAMEVRFATSGAIAVELTRDAFQLRTEKEVKQAIARKLHVSAHTLRLLDRHDVIAADHVFAGDAFVLDVVLVPCEPWSAESSRAVGCAARSNDVAALERLLDIPVDPNHSDDFGCAPLRLASSGPCWLHSFIGAAAERGRVAMVSLLLARRAACGAMASDGEAPLLAAAREGHIEIVSLLLAHGADVDQSHPGGDTALQVATRYGHLPVLTALLDAAASRSQCDVTGETCLTVAAKAGNVDVARLLVDGGAFM